jgi:hypothetical protein
MRHAEDRLFLSLVLQFGVLALIVASLGWIIWQSLQMAAPRPVLDPRQAIQYVSPTVAVLALLVSIWRTFEERQYQQGVARNLFEADLDRLEEHLNELVGPSSPTVESVDYPSIRQALQFQTQVRQIERDAVTTLMPHIAKLEAALSRYRQNRTAILRRSELRRTAQVTLKCLRFIRGEG